MKDQVEMVKNHLESKGGEFYAVVAKMVAAAEQYLDYMESNKVPEEVEKLIFRLVASTLTLNRKIFKQTEDELGHFRAQNPEFEAISAPGTSESLWAGTSKVLYGTAHSQEREEFREALTAFSHQLERSGQHHFMDVDHLERFLELPSIQAGESISTWKRRVLPPYLEENADRINAYYPLALEEFEKWLVDSHLSEEDLVELDAELASIKPEDIQSALGGQFVGKDRTSKLRLVRDLRFGRVAFDELEARVEAREAEITNHLSELKPILGPVLRGNLPKFLTLLEDTKALPSEERKAKVSELIETYSLSVPKTHKKRAIFILQNTLLTTVINIF